jgi:hypothetical protein
MADNSLLISKYIQQILEESNEVKAIVGNDEHKIFPLLQPDNLNFPFIVHARTGLSVQYTKDIEIGHVGWCNTINYTITCVSNDYIQCIELANAVRHAVETYRWRTNDIYIHPIQLLTATEYTLDNDAFVEELQFQMTVE